MKHTYDWQAEPEGFMKWMLPTITSEKIRDDEKFEALSAATDRFTNVEIGITISGIEVDALAFLNGFKRNFDYAVQQQVEEKIDEADLNRLYDSLADVQRAVRKTIVDRLAAVGVELREEDDY